MVEQRYLGRSALYRIEKDDLARVAALPGPNNSVKVGDAFPMIITRDWGNGSVNGTVFLDGSDTLWVTSVKEGLVPGTFDRIHRLSEVAFA